MENRQRHGNRRHSGIYEYNGQGHAVQRRTSKKTSSRDRHGQIYPDGFAEASVRAVPPEPVRGTAFDGLALEPTSITPSLMASPKSRIGVDTNGQASTPHPESISRRNGLTSHAATEPLSRPRTRTLEERNRDRSPTSLVSKTRSRIGSLQSTAPAPLQIPAEDITSIGFPSIIPSPPLPSQSQINRQRLVKPPPRPLSPFAHVHPTQHAVPQSSPNTDTGKILQLMKITCGRMHGILSFRSAGSSSWSSGYCAINVATGSLIYQTKGEISLAKTLIPDLRGCKVRTMLDKANGLTYLDVSTHTSGFGIHLRPHVPETFDSWLAALLCWQPIRPKGVQNKMTKPQTTVVAERRLGDRKRNSAISTTKDAAIIKVGKMLFWDADMHSSAPSVHSNRRISTYKQQRSISNTWQKVSCTLQENGYLKLFTESDTSLVSIIPLSSLSRCAIQRLEPSVLDDEFCLAIYPRYIASNATLSSMHAIYLSLESRVLFEVWFVLLRAFTVPDLYGPEESSLLSTTLSPGPSSEAQQAPSHTNVFRVERHLYLRVTEAKVHAPRETTDFSTRTSPRTGSSHGQDWVTGDYYAEVMLDGETRARTAFKTDTSNPFWREDYEFLDLPPVLSSASVVLKTRNMEQRDWTLVSHGTLDYEKGEVNALSAGGDIEISPMDSMYGTVDLRLSDVERGKDNERWWPICNEREEVVGEMFMKLRLEESVVLLSQDYQQLSETLSSFSNGLTQQMAAALPSDLRRLAETLVNIFQVSAQAGDWIMSLVEDEIDGLHRDTPVSRFRYSRRIASHDSYDAGVERELLLRDLGRTATVEANLLFRGNSLLTKALDLHMRRLGKEYLEDTLSERIRDIDESDPDCEVDPNRVQHPDDLQRNRRNLIALTEAIWKSIYASAPRCPPELRAIFRHIRACADDRFGDFLRTVTYSSVSGFLFLRFFCPAVLNPKLFGLLKDHPRPRAQRTLTLIAKSLQTFANLNTFGSKEEWMAPMNTFLTSHRQEFKTFVDNICAISSDRATSAIPPSYATPVTILSRLPMLNREGFPSLPFLIDQARELATLVSIWSDGKDVALLQAGSEELKRFDALCEGLCAQTRECLNMAEQAERPSGVLEVKWEEMIEQMGRRAMIKSPPGVADDQSEPVTPPASSDTEETPRVMARKSSSVENGSAASLPESYFDLSSRPQGGYPTLNPNSNPASARFHHQPQAATEDLTRSSSEAGFDPTPPGSSSGIWDPGTQPLGRRRLLPPANLSHTTSASNTEGKDEPMTAGGESEGEGRPSADSSLYSLEAMAGSAAERSPASVKDGRGRLGDVWGFRKRKGGGAGTGAGAGERGSSSRREGG